MDFALTYLLARLWYRFIDFFHHWYVDGSVAIAHRFVSALERADRSLAIRVTFRYFFQPLYRDYSIIGRILGVIFRTGRILIGLAVYAVIASFFLLFYLAWIATPALILLYVIRSL